ncbi:hypothetical protein BKA56DRAFT_605349 [Ilyonectria sp. MPI-CAGE-AT-0026]|nr:hypothetical protein BKA56DRAFT_605349 [Ilyonectria sp. MPI-CAGE-AT-0026]
MSTTNGGGATMSLIVHFIPLFSQLLITMLAGSPTNRRCGSRPLVAQLPASGSGRKWELDAEMAGLNGLGALTLLIRRLAGGGSVGAG